jgi:predicted phage tail protein
MWGRNVAAIRGAKGGGKGGGGSGGSTPPTEERDSLRSRQYARIIDLISEGEIEGFATGDLQSVYYDRTPLKNSDGSYNFTGVTVESRNGTQSQSYISGFPSVESEIPVNVQMFENIGVVRTITAAEADAVRVTVSIPALVRTDTQSGNVEGAELSYSIQLQSNGGGFTEVYRESIKGKTTTKYQRSYVVPLTGSPPWDVRLVRMTDDSNSQYLQNQTFWESYTTIVNSKLRYPNSALVATTIDSKQFSSIPVRSYDMKLLRTQIPSNATVRPDGSLTYSGTWNGTFQIAWHANPAWVFWDMMTNERYGLGNFVDVDQIDKWSLYQIGQYCDELVPDGFGGFEPRFLCNIYFQQQAEAFKVIQDLASVFRGLVYWASGQITATQDAPADVSALYTCANVVDGQFTYSGSSLKTRHTVALVNWNDPDDFYTLKPEYVEDRAGIERYGIIPTSIVAVGCTSRGQAHRVGKWLLYSEGNETETVSFRAGLDGILVRPGEIIAVQDKNRAGSRRGGRITTATQSSVTVDNPFIPTVGMTYTLSVMLPDGTVGTSVVVNVAGNTLNLATPLPIAPQANAIWMVSSADLATQLFRVVAVIDAGDGTIEITGLKHNPEKFDFVEDGLFLTENPISILNNPPNAPQNVQISESLYQSGSTVSAVVNISWDQVERADSYILVYQVDSNNPVIIDNVRTQNYDIWDAIPGLYNVSVVAVSINKKRSQSSAVTRVIFGKTAPPIDVQNFSLVGVTGGVAQLVWDQATDLDVQIGGYVRIRHTPDTTTPTWSNAVDIGPALPGGATTASVPHIDGTYLAKFVDSSGNSSVNASQVITRTASLIAMNVVTTINESTFAGTKTNTVYPGPFGGLSIGRTGLFDEIADLDSVFLLDSYGPIASSGEYLFASTFDLGGVYVSRLTAAITAQAYDDSATFDERLESIDDWGAFDGNVVDDVNAALFVRTTNDNPSGSPVWGSWRPFFVGQYEARAYQFKLLLTSANVGHNINVSQLVVTVDMPDRVESQRNITSGTGTLAVTFPVAFRVTPSIGITANNMATGDYYTITGASATGFSIQFRNSAGTGVSRVFDYIAKGYGYQT